MLKVIPVPWIILEKFTFSLLKLKPPIINLFCISRDKGLYRVKMPELLWVAKELWNVTDYRGVYINKDLTFKQRKLLNERCQRL